MVGGDSSAVGAWTRGVQVARGVVCAAGPRFVFLRTRCRVVMVRSYARATQRPQGGARPIISEEVWISESRHVRRNDGLVFCDLDLALRPVAQGFIFAGR